MTKIEIEHIEIESTILKIRDEIIKRCETSGLEQYPKKFDTWIDNLNYILYQISKIDEILLLMKKDLKFSFRNKNLIATALVQPSFKNTFDEILVHFNNDPDFEISKGDLEKLKTIPDTAKSLAWIGDTAIKICSFTQNLETRNYFRRIA